MPYRHTAFYPGGYYHIFNRGNNREPIFFELDNYRYFLRQLEKYFVPDRAELIAYCLMPNHYHLIVCLHIEDLAPIMQPFTLSYSKAIGKRFGRVGSLFQGPFKSIHIEKNEYFLHLSRYVHLNPVVAGLVKQPEEWEFSSYRDYLGLRQSALVHPEIVLSQFGSSDYRKFVADYQPGDFEQIANMVLE